MVGLLFSIFSPTTVSENILDMTNKLVANFDKHFQNFVESDVIPPYSDIVTENSKLATDLSNAQFPSAYVLSDRRVAVEEVRILYESLSNVKRSDELIQALNRYSEEASNLIVLLAKLQSTSCTCITRLKTVSELVKEGLEKGTMNKDGFRRALKTSNDTAQNLLQSLISVQIKINLTETALVVIKQTFISEISDEEKDIGVLLTELLRKGWKKSPIIDYERNEQLLKTIEQGTSLAKADLIFLVFRLKQFMKSLQELDYPSSSNTRNTLQIQSLEIEKALNVIQTAEKLLQQRMKAS